MDFNPNVVISLSAKMNTDGTAAVCNPPLAKNIFFVSGGAFTTGAACTIVGNVLANGAITAGATNPSGSTTVTGQYFFVSVLRFLNLTLSISFRFALNDGSFDCRSWSTPQPRFHFYLLHSPICLIYPHELITVILYAIELRKRK